MIKELMLNLFKSSMIMGALIVAVALLSPLFHKRYRAKMKIWIWLAIAVGLLIPFHFSPVNTPIEVTVNDGTVLEVPRANVAVPDAEEPQPLEPDENQMNSNDPNQNNGSELPPDNTQQQPEETPQTANPTTNTYQISVIDIVIGIWLAGFLAYTIFQSMTALRLHALLKKAERPAAGSPICERLQSVKAEMKIKRPIGVLIWDQAPSPFLVGLFRRKLVLPSQSYPPDELDLIMKHEMTHQKRGDLWYKAFLNIVNALHWFNPIVYYMKKCAAQDLELLCDEIITKNRDMDFRKSYSELLLHSIEHRHRRRLPAVSTTMSADVKTLKGRMQCIMSAKNKKKGITVISCLVLCMILVGNLIGCNLFRKEPSVKGMWVLMTDADYASVIVIGEETFHCFYFNSQQQIAEENIADLLIDAPAYTYSYTYDKDTQIISLTEQFAVETSTAMAIDYAVQFFEEDQEVAFSAANDGFFVGGRYSYIAQMPEEFSAEGFSFENVNGLLTQDYIKGTWINNGNGNADGSVHSFPGDLINDEKYVSNIMSASIDYKVLSVNDYYSVGFWIYSTVNLETGVIDERTGFYCDVQEDVTKADSFYEFVVENSRSITTIKRTEDVGIYFKSDPPENTYHAVITNKGILLSSKGTQDAPFDGCYWRGAADSSIEGAWMQPLGLSRDGDYGYLFETIKDGIWNPSESKEFDSISDIDHSQLSRIYSDNYSANNKYKHAYQVFEGGKLFYPNVCFWPVHVTSKLMIWGVSGSLDELPKYWVGMYRVLQGNEL